MKKNKYFVTLTLLAMTTLTACDTSGRYRDHKIPDRDIHVIYFSAFDNCGDIATFIKEYYECEMTRLYPEVAYVEEDLDFENKETRGWLEQNDQVPYPALLNGVENLASYDVLFIGYPLWMEKLPRLLYTFFNLYDFSNYTIVPFCVSEELGISVSETEIHQLEPQAELISGERFSIYGTKKSNIYEWLGGIYKTLSTN